MDIKQPLITMCGNSRLCIENFKAIMCYMDDVVKIMTLTGVLVIKGCNIVIEYFDKEEIIIAGLIEYIGFGEIDE